VVWETEKHVDTRWAWETIGGGGGKTGKQSPEGGGIQQRSSETQKKGGCGLLACGGVNATKELVGSKAGRANERAPPGSPVGGFYQV